MSLIGMAPEDFIRLEMPPECRCLSVSQLLDRAFPPSLEEQQAIAVQFDLRANPDLPGIYAVFLAACEEWRDWRCGLRVTSATGDDVDLTAPVLELLTAGPELVEGPSVHPSTSSGRTDYLFLRLAQQYRAIEYAVRHGFWTNRRELLDWTRSLTALYFIDKHEALLHPGSAPESASALRGALASLQSQGLIAAQLPENLPLPPGEGWGEGVPPYAITPLGRRFIAGLLTETESLIDRYDHYKDIVIDLDRETAEFDTGRGADLRVAAFLAEGLDPIRAVFLLRLYDGTFDHRLRDWQDAIEGEEFYEGILEPVVNRDGAGPEAMDLVIESGLSWLEERQEQTRREEAEQEILRRAENDLY